MSDIGGLGSGGYNLYAERIQQFQQNLFNKIDTNCDGSITQSELEKAVTSAGGTSQSADALYALLDPNNTGSVSEQQFAQNLPAPPYSDQMGAQLIADQAQQSGGTNTAGPGGALAQSLFSQIDADGDGSITQSELEKAVTAAGGTTQAADALYAKLDPNNTGSVSEAAFAQALQPPSTSGNSAQDALFALINSLDGSATAATTSTTTASTSASSGTSAEDALWSLINGTDGTSATSGTQTGGNTAQDALFALLQGNTAAWPNGWGGVDPQTASGTDLASMVSLFDTLGQSNQTSQQLLSSLFDAVNRGG